MSGSIKEIETILLTEIGKIKKISAKSDTRLDSASITNLERLSKIAMTLGIGFDMNTGEAKKTLTVGELVEIAKALKLSGGDKPSGD